MGNTLSCRLCWGAVVETDDDGYLPWNKRYEFDANGNKIVGNDPWYVGNKDKWLASLFGATADSTWEERRAIVPKCVEIEYASWGDECLPCYIYVHEEVWSMDSGIIRIHPESLKVPDLARERMNSLIQISGLPLEPGWLIAYSFG